jgi:hypothetical protein
MKLNKSELAFRGKSINKFSLKCDDDKDKWFNLIEILHKTDNLNSVIIAGFLLVAQNLIILDNYYI